jgi:hypothetical protein
VQTIHNTIDTSTYITKTPNQFSKHLHITTPTHAHTQTLQTPDITNPTHAHTSTHYKTHTYTHPHITIPVKTTTHNTMYYLF